MSDEPELVELKQRLTPLLIDIAGVSGVGISEGTLIVYLEKDSEEIRRAIRCVLETHAPQVDVKYVVTGAFRPL